MAVVTFCPIVEMQASCSRRDVMHYQDFDKSLPLNCYPVAFWPEFILASVEMTVCSDILLCSNRALPSDLKIFHYLFLLS